MEQIRSWHILFVNYIVLNISYSLKSRKIARKQTAMVVTTTEELKSANNLLCILGTSDILRCIFKVYNIKYTFYSKETIRNILLHPKH